MLNFQLSGKGLRKVNLVICPIYIDVCLADLHVPLRYKYLSNDSKIVTKPKESYEIYTEILINKTEIRTCSNNNN